MVQLKTFTYSPDKVFVLVGGVPIFTFNSVKVSYVRPRWTFYEGTRGEITRGASYTTLGIITLTIPKSSPFNDAITVFYGFKQVIPIIVKELLGASLHTMLRGTIISAPDVEYAKNITDIEWQFQGLVDINIIGGSYV